MPGPAWVWSGVDGPPSDLLRRLASGRPSWAYGIDVEKAGLRDGEVQVTLFLRSKHDPMTITFQAAYAHLDRWVVQSNTVTCAYPSA